MDGTNPKVSFIPKGSLVHQDSFLERSRPRSVIGIIAIIAFVLSVGSYVGLFYYNDSLNQIVVEKTGEIEKAQKEFSDAPEVGEAKIFRARADLARELLNAHTVASPVLEFLSKNTTESILFTRFSFKNDETGSALSLTGEAPNYAALAYQVDVLRGKTSELAGLSVGDVGLTEYGSINFTFTMAFKPEYLLYTKNVNAVENVVPAVTSPATGSDSSFAPKFNFDTPPAAMPAPAPTPIMIPVPVIPSPITNATSSSSSPSLSSGTSTTLLVLAPPSSVAATTTDSVIATSSEDVESMQSEEVPPVYVTEGTAGKQSFLQLFWSKFKFW